ncbi:hypothetical protein Tsubulata_030194, partial [Turnera subulata]
AWAQQTNPLDPSRRAREFITGQKLDIEAQIRRGKMVKVATFFAMSVGAFIFWQSMEKIHVYIALHQDEKRLAKEAEVRRVREQLLREAKEKESIA